MKIQEFSFGNFKSFKDIQTLNLSAAKIKSKNPEIDLNNIIKINGDKTISFLKSKAIYGANASGKSNIIKALVKFIRVVRRSVKDEGILNNDIDTFRLSTESENEPSFFQLIFWINNTRYRYGFEISKNIVNAEWLYGKPGERETPYFIRDNQEIIKLDKTNYSEGNKLMNLLDEDSDDNDIFRKNSLFLSALASFGFGKLSKLIAESIASIFVISGLGQKGLMDSANISLKDVEKKKYMLDFLKYGDVSIDDINAIEIKSEDLPDDFDNDLKNKIDKMEDTRLLVSTKKVYDSNLEAKYKGYFSFLAEESEGTKKLFELSPFIYEALKNERPIVIDEFDSRFHPLLTKRILELFNSKENKGTQFVFTTHDTNLLSADLLRRDQIEFVEKDKYGASHLYSLAEFKGIRNNATFEKDYIQGKYGAIPFLGDFSKLINTETNAEEN